MRITNLEYPQQEFPLEQERPIFRLADIILSVCGLIALIPVFLITGIFVKVTSRGSIIFKQTRIGKGGKLFTLYKFRTMNTNAERQKLKLVKLNEVSGPTFKMANDPRITKIGKILRKYSIDELPQLFNVLKGDMSIVGPRPSLPSEVAKYKNWQIERLSVKPGLTCIWQVSGRNKIGFDEWMRLDIKYIRNKCMRLYILLIFKTLKVVLIKPDGI